MGRCTQARNNRLTRLVLWYQAWALRAHMECALRSVSEMKTRAAVAFEAKQPLEIVELDIEGPKASAS